MKSKWKYRNAFINESETLRNNIQTFANCKKRELELKINNVKQYTTGKKIIKGKKTNLP